MPSLLSIRSRHRAHNEPASRAGKKPLVLSVSRIIVTALCCYGVFVTQAFAQSAGLAEALQRYQPAIEHQSDLLVGKERFIFLKLNDGKNLTEIALDSTGKAHDPASVLQQYRTQFAKYGRLHPTLYRTLLSSGATAFEVMIWLKLTPMQSIEKPSVVEKGTEEHTLQSLGSAHQKSLEALLTEKASVLRQLGLQTLVNPPRMHDTPFVTARLSRPQIKTLSTSPLVHMLLLYDPKGRDDLATSLAISNADDVQANGITGERVRVAVWENRPTNTTNLNIVDSYSAFANIVPSTTDHAQNVSAIINNSTAVSGYAPDSEFYAADSPDIAALDWAVDTERVSALNQSFHRGAEIGDGLQADDLYKDYKVLHYPWPTIVQAAGNWCAAGTSCDEGGSDVTAEFVNHKGFNSISIANHNDTATQMSASSCFVNPTSPHSDRELPELSANGTSVTADGLTLSGTSMASPAVTGSVALLQEANSTLRIWPEGARALLFAGARTNIPSHAGQLAAGGNAADAPNTWWRDVNLGHDGFDGAGALNIEQAVAIVQQRWNGAASSRGWDIGTMWDRSFDARGFFARTYQVSTPPLAISQPHIKVALAWNSTATESGAAPEEVYASELGLDLDIRVYDSTGTQVAHSLSWDNSYEIVDFDARLGETYTIKVHRWSTKPNAWSWFGIAWDTHWYRRSLAINELAFD